MRRMYIGRIVRTNEDAQLAVTIHSQPRLDWHRLVTASLVSIFALRNKTDTFAQALAFAPAVVDGLTSRRQ